MRTDISRDPKTVHPDATAEWTVFRFTDDRADLQRVYGSLEQSDSERLFVQGLGGWSVVVRVFPGGRCLTPSFVVRMTLPNSVYCDEGLKERVATFESLPLESVGMFEQKNHNPKTFGFATAVSLEARGQHGCALPSLQ